ncbi:unnamed protein product [Lupinus luteus]|uniref:Uncharacterized protein n=1 Tax=Lupinus luteus TaxID=3873 RepID=A0AAV1XPY0_LUPLU
MRESGVATGGCRFKEDGGSKSDRELRGDVNKSDMIALTICQIVDTSIRE